MFIPSTCSKDLIFNLLIYILIYIHIHIYVYISVSGHKWSTTQSVQISQKQDERKIYVIMKTLCPPGYHRNGFVATHALGHMMYGWGVFKPGVYIYNRVYIYIYIYTHTHTHTHTHTTVDTWYTCIDTRVPKCLIPHSPSNHCGDTVPRKVCCIKNIHIKLILLY